MEIPLRLKILGNHEMSINEYLGSLSEPKSLEIPKPIESIKETW